MYIYYLEFIHSKNKNVKWLFYIVMIHSLMISSLYHNFSWNDTKFSMLLIGLVFFYMKYLFSFSACTDESEYCSVVKMMKFCKFDNFRRNCCVSCTKSWRAVNEGLSQFFNVLTQYDACWRFDTMYDKATSFLLLSEASCGPLFYFVLQL